jgi:hypothetical protein
MNCVPGLGDLHRWRVLWSSGPGTHARLPFPPQSMLLPSFGSGDGSLPRPNAPLCFQTPTCTHSKIGLASSSKFCLA